MQTPNTEGAENFIWYLKSLQENDLQNQDISPEKEFRLLRFVKVFSPTIKTLGEVGGKELGLPLLSVAEILDKLEKKDEIQFQPSASGNEEEKVVKITKKGLQRLETGV